MAELVGDAYIRITGDVSGMRREMSKAMKNAGKDDADNYVRTFSNEVESIADQKMRGARTALAKAMVDPKEFDKLAKGFGSVEDAAESWRLELRKLSREHRIATGHYDKFKTAINEWEASAISARETTAREADALWQATRAREAYAKRFKEASLLREHHLRGMRRDIDLTDRYGHTLDRIAVGFGKAFGKGARNNFVNLVGVMAGGIAKIIALAGKAALAVGDLLLDLPKLFGGGGGAGGIAGAGKMAASSMESLGAAAPELAAAFAGPQGIIVAVVAAGAALFAFAEILPGIVSLVGLLAGVVVSLAGSITFALTGALLAFIPVAAGAVASLGAVGGAFVEFFTNKKNKQFVKEFIQPFKDFGDQFQKPVKSFLTTLKSGFKPLFEDLTPSVNRFFASWKKNLGDAQTTRRLGAFGDSIGRIATTFSGAIPKLFSGLIGFFRPILPYAEKLATAIGNAFANFDKWANSTKGQNAIADFMQEAWHSATLVWDILKEIGRIIWTVFDAGQDTGQSFLDGILDKLTEIRTFLQSDEGKAKMKEWFGNVKEVGEDIGSIAESIGSMIASLSSPEGQANAKAIMDAIVGMAKMANTIFGLANDIDRIIKAVFASKSPPAPPTVKTETPQEKANRIDKALSAYMVTIDVDDKMYQQKIQAIEGYKMGNKDLLIKGNEDLWIAMRDTVGAYVFKEKQIPIDGNTEEWDRDKGTVAGYVFQPKAVPIVVNDKAVQDWVAKWNRMTIQTKTARINVSTSSGGGRNYGGGIPKDSAAGGFFDQPTIRRIGEAGPEAVVPLDRDLSRVDPAVRQMSAVLQSMTGGRGGGQGGTIGPKVNFEAGAFAVNLPTGDPQLAAEAVLDRLVAFIR